MRDEKLEWIEMLEWIVRLMFQRFLYQTRGDTIRQYDMAELSSSWGVCEVGGEESGEESDIAVAMCEVAR